MFMLSEEQNRKFIIYCQKYIPEYILRGEDSFPFLYDEKCNMYCPLYQYDNENINFVFGRLHYYVNGWFEENKLRVQTKANRYLTSASRSEICTFNEIINRFVELFRSCDITFTVESYYKSKIEEVVDFISHEESKEFILPDNYEPLQTVITEPIFKLITSISFPASKFLIFGTSKTKPDIIVKNVLDGDLSVLNSNKVLVYTDEIKDSLTYSDFTKWWQRNRTKYVWYKASEHLNEIELKIANFYKTNYGKDDANPVLIPQVYLHYDPKDKKVREYYGNSSGLKFQRMDFLILYKGHRVIIEIDGREHFENAEEYSKQCAYDREMRFLGYDIFRLGGYELTYNFDETVFKFFTSLFEYLS